MTHRIKLSPAQHGALQCREDGGLDPLTLAAWDGSHLTFEESDKEDLFSELIDACNAEDVHMEMLRKDGELECAKLAGRAARSLGTLAGKVLTS